ncbi:MAG: hypothetical protein FJ357_00195 [Thaumarchaeota archaeon]|nr:hypothetical protein [Nitrososphaerota archaeon]
MSKTIQEVAQKELWVLVSQLKENTGNSELERIAPQVLYIIDQWKDSGKFIWSGPFGDDAGGMAVFEATQDEANTFVKNYGDLVSGVLIYHVYKWDVLWGSK